MVTNPSLGVKATILPAFIKDADGFMFVSMDFYQSLGTAAPSSSPARGPFAAPRS